MTRVTLPSAYNFDDTQAWPWDIPQYNETTGVLTVTIDMNKVTNFQTQYDTTRKKHCQPISFCSWTGDVSTGSCGCNNNATLGYPFPNSVKNECTAASAKTICSWASTDVDCPDGGCYGFGVTLSANFEVSNNPPTPGPSVACFGKAAWAVPPFTSIGNPADACNYTTGMDGNIPPQQMTCAP